MSTNKYPLSPPVHLNIPPRDIKNHPVTVIKRINEKCHRPAFISGPMVRYSKLPFRELVRHHDTDIVYTPMILAREFVRNGVARASDFSTNNKDAPVVAQFGANNEIDLVRAVSMILPYVDGIGLNCGCPIKDQVREGIGAALMTNLPNVVNMVKAVKSKFGEQVCMEVKIRIHKDLNETVEFAKSVEKAGADYITVHGRLKPQRSSEACNFEAIKLIKSSVSIPVVANGDAFSVEDALRIAHYTGVDGVMAARGILQNPAMFDIMAYRERRNYIKQLGEPVPGKFRNTLRINDEYTDFVDKIMEPVPILRQCEIESQTPELPVSQPTVDGKPAHILKAHLYNTTPWSSIERFWDIVTAYGLPYRVTQHHFSEFLDTTLSKTDKKSMNDTKNLVELLQWFDERFDLKRPNQPGAFEDREYPWKEEYLKAQELLNQEEASGQVKESKSTTDQLIAESNQPAYDQINIDIKNLQISPKIAS